MLEGYEKKENSVIELDTSDIPEVDDDEQAELEAILEAITEEDRQIAFTHVVIA